MLVLHLRSLEAGVLAHWMFKEQRAQGWPGLAVEAERICRELGVEDCNTTKCSKVEYRKIVSEACHLKNEKMLRKQAERKEKCMKMADEKYGRKEYLEQKYIEEVRLWYRTRFGQRPFAGNFSHDMKYANTRWLCRCGVEKEK